MTSATITLTDSPAGTVSGLLTFEPHEPGAPLTPAQLIAHLMFPLSNEPNLLAYIDRLQQENKELHERLNGREFDH